MKHNTLTKIITLALAVVLALSLAACGSKTNDDSGDKTDAPVIKIGVPNDTTNEARALLLLQENGIIKPSVRVFDVTAIVYYLSVTGFFLFLSVQSLEKRRWSE